MALLKIGLLGFGTVSSGFYRRLQVVQEKIAKQTGLEPVVEKILIRSGEESRIPVGSEAKIVYEANAILEDPSIQVVVEAINGDEPAASFICKALSEGKHVITANKAAIANHWELIHEAARKSGAKLYYEASVCAGIPLIQVIETLSLSDKILSVEGIVNGTSNYILSAMASEKIDYELALEQAKVLGYAESDPTADVDGWDAANKLSILCGLSFGQIIAPSDIPKDSLRSLKSVEKGLKLVASASFDLSEIQLEAAVSLKQLSPEHPLYQVDGVDNGVVIVTEGIGQIKLFGPGAGSDPTGTAMVSDLVQLATAISIQSRY
jgi:homoserine dehydrogenase